MLYRTGCIALATSSEPQWANALSFGYRCPTQELLHGSIGSDALAYRLGVNCRQ